MECRQSEVGIQMLINHCLAYNSHMSLGVITIIVVSFRSRSLIKASVAEWSGCLHIRLILIIRLYRCLPRFPLLPPVLPLPRHLPLFFPP